MPENITIYDPMRSRPEKVMTIRNADGSMAIVFNETKERMAQITQSESQMVKDEALRLYALAETIMEGNTEIFDCLPRKKDGSLPKNQVILVADTSYKCTDGANYDGIIQSQRIQMRLESVYADCDDYVHGRHIPNVKELCIGWRDTTKKRTPIFDRNGNCHKPDNKKTVYLKNDQIQQGILYEEPSGTQYLCLTGMDVKEETIYHRQDGSTWNGGGYNYSYGINIYLRWSAAIEKRLGEDLSLENILQDIITRKHNLDSLSCRTNPRKFTKQVRRIYDPEDVKPATISDTHIRYDEKVTSIYHIRKEG